KIMPEASKFAGSQPKNHARDIKYCGVTPSKAYLSHQMWRGLPGTASRRCRVYFHIYDNASMITTVAGGGIEYIGRLSITCIDQGARPASPPHAARLAALPIAPGARAASPHNAASYSASCRALLRVTGFQLRTSRI